VQPDAHLVAAVQRGVVEQVVDDEAHALGPAVDRGLRRLVGEREARRRVPALRGVDRGIDDVAHLDGLARQGLGRLAAARAPAALEQVHDPLLLGGHLADEPRRCATGRSSLRASVSSVARRPVSGVRSSWPASAAKRRVASSACSSASVDARSRRASR
jgi:hypothetical protein